MPVAVALMLALAACGAEVPSTRPDAAGDGLSAVPDGGFPGADAAGDSRGTGGGDSGVDAPGDGGAPSDGSDDTTADVCVEVCNVSGNLNLRSGPSTNDAVIASMPGGTKLRVISTSGNWTQVDYNGQIGWASSTYLCPSTPPGGTQDGGGASNDGSPGAAIGTMWITYYYLANESDYSGSKNTTLYDSNCQAIAVVSASYSDAVCIEGSGKLQSGDVINYAKSCSCGRPCPTGGTVCYKKLPASQPWGQGAYSNALVPFRSIAVDKSFLALKRVIYLKEWDGVAIPALGGIGGFVHDGCFRADDIGGAITGNHFDFFSGTRAMYLALDKIFATKSNFSAYDGGTRCAYLAP
ncbi:MAG: SH3 domain-containing protein [Myxococcales bacterium]|nr:SH3 domain-containing protein [Myxococcales bacterium]